jgi:hypothetical protein
VPGTGCRPGEADDLVVGKADRLVVPTDPGLCVVGFAEHVEQLVAGGRVAQPGLVRGGQHVRRGVLPDPVAADRVEGVSGEAVADLGEARGGDRDLEVPCSRVWVPRNRSSAQPAATYQGVVIPASCCAT